MSNFLPNDSLETRISPNEAAEFLQAFVKCNRDIQNIVVEMSEIITSEQSSEDERAVAFDAMMEALFPGTASDILEVYHQRLKSPEAAESAAALKAEESHFADQVRALMARKCITQEQLAKEAGIGQPAISNLLNRHCRPQRRTVVRFAKILGVQPVELWPQWSLQEPV